MIYCKNQTGVFVSLFVAIDSSPRHSVSFISGLFNFLINKAVWGVFQNPIIGIFWNLAQCWGFLMQLKWHFRIWPKTHVVPISRNLVIGSFSFGYILFWGLCSKSSGKILFQGCFGPFLVPHSVVGFSLCCLSLRLSNKELKIHS